MNITPQSPFQPIATSVNLPTDSLRRDNVVREVIAQPAAAGQSAAEKGVASDRDKAKTPSQQSEQIDFATLQKKAEKQATTITDGSQREQSDSENSSNKQNAFAQQNEAEHSDAKDHNGLTAAQLQDIKELQQRDKEVRQHERSHAAVGGAFTGAPSYSFEVGPDSKKYAVDGEVSVDLAPVDSNPQATITKMQKVYAAALAPANPSIQDTRVANSAAKIIAQAQSQLLDEKLAEVDEESTSDESKIKVSVNEEKIGEGKGTRINQAFTSDLELNSNKSNDFDRFINSTLASQDAIIPTRTSDISQRALRIEDFYLKINQAYEKPPSYQFQLTA